MSRCVAVISDVFLASCLYLTVICLNWSAHVYQKIGQNDTPAIRYPSVNEILPMPWSCLVLSTVPCRLTKKSVQSVDTI